MAWAILAAAYLSGSIPFALLVVRALTGKDIRKVGSGNVGATNAVRAAGIPAGIAVTILDVGKGTLPVLLMQAHDPSARWVGAAAVAAVAGHCFPVWLGFSGGKGVATGLGAFWVIAPRAILAAVGVWLLVLLLGRIVSLASVLATASFPVWVFFLERGPRAEVAAASLFALIVIVRHHRNLRRLAAGTEPRLKRGGAPWDDDSGGDVP